MQSHGQISKQAIAYQGKAPVMVVTGNLQIPLANALAEQQIDWQHVEVFHMDEYVGLTAGHPAEIERYSSLLRAETCPASLTHTHPNTSIYLDVPSASLWAYQ